MHSMNKTIFFLQSHAETLDDPQIATCYDGAFKVSLLSTTGSLSGKPEGLSTFPSGRQACGTHGIYGGLPLCPDSVALDGVDTQVLPSHCGKQADGDGDEDDADDKPADRARRRGQETHS